MNSPENTHNIPEVYDPNIDFKDALAAYSSQDQEALPEDQSEQPTGLDLDRAAASDFGREVAGRQAELYERTLLALMERSADNPELAEAVDGFTRELMVRAYFGSSDQPLKPHEQQALVESLHEATDKLAVK